jgi:hypothetical protein
MWLQALGLAECSIGIRESCSMAVSCTQMKSQPTRLVFCDQDHSGRLLYVCMKEFKCASPTPLLTPAFTSQDPLQVDRVISAVCDHGLPALFSSHAVGQNAGANSQTRVAASTALLDVCVWA